MINVSTLTRLSLVALTLAITSPLATAGDEVEFTKTFAADEFYRLPLHVRDDGDVEIEAKFRSVVPTRVRVYLVAQLQNGNWVNLETRQKVSTKGKIEFEHDISDAELSQYVRVEMWVSSTEASRIRFEVEIPD